MSKINETNFIELAKEKHCDKYTYENVIYVNNKTKVEITCLKHGIFEQTPANHMKGKGCAKCAQNVKMTKETFIKNAINVHLNKYDYSNVDYIDRNTKVKILCIYHNFIFEQSPRSHLMGHNCPKCSNTYKKTNEEWILEFNQVHNYFYDYKLCRDIIYKSNKEKIEIICPIHGIFEQSRSKHLRSGCKKCGIISTTIKNERRRYENKRTFLYYIKINEYYKVGLTQTNLTTRFRQENIDYNIIYIWEFENGYDALLLEQEILLKTYNHMINKDESPIIGGWTEIRSIDIKDIVFKTVTKYLNKL